MASTSCTSERVFQLSLSSLALLAHQLQQSSDSFTGPRKAATMAITPAMAERISLVLWKRTITRTNEAFSRPTFATSSFHSFWSLQIRVSIRTIHWWISPSDNCYTADVCKMWWGSPRRSQTSLCWRQLHPKEKVWDCPSPVSSWMRPTSWALSRQRWRRTATLHCPQGGAYRREQHCINTGTSWKLYADKRKDAHCDEEKRTGFNALRLWWYFLWGRSLSLLSSRSGCRSDSSDCVLHRKLVF